MRADERDEITCIILRLMEELLADGGFALPARVSGYAFIARPGGTPAVIRIYPGGFGVLSPEVTEGEGEIYITAAVPPGSGAPPSVTFQPLLVGISLGEETTVVDLPSRIDLQGCSWQVNNGVLDISCRKA
ncbi:MAG TPA: Hsp20/alpha crystallin family protein [Methanomicrobiales archaeon]|jgi:hypothetical protein|nr:Hsp20/alpha crystallin family protein [Methanomicrobiales archaeon]